MRLVRVIAFGAGTALAALASPAHATMFACITDELGTPLRRVWVENRSALFDTPDRVKRTNELGCIAFDVSVPIDLRVHAHNPVVRIHDGHALNIAVWEDMKAVANGETRSLQANRQGAHFRVAERFLRAYDDGLRQLPPWSDAEFPAGQERQPAYSTVKTNQYILRASFPSLVAIRAWVEPAALTSPPVQAMGFPLLHIPQSAVLEEERLVQDTFAHELGHALHFSRLSNDKRVDFEANYAEFLVRDPEKVHCIDKRTNKEVAWIEAFGLFAQDFAFAPGSGTQKHEEFFGIAAGRRRLLLDGEDPLCFPTGTDTPETGPMFGPDVEGAVYLALFRNFAMHPAVGLPFVVETYVNCQSADIDGYAACIKTRFGSFSPIYQALVSAASCNGIFFHGATGPPPMVGLSENADRFGRALARGDFNGDGYDDLAIGVPGEDGGSTAQSGAVSVLYGLPSGLNAQCNQVFSQSTAGITGTSEDGDNFGSALATGDFDADNFDDLVIGVPGEDESGVVDAGSVYVLRGSIHGLQGTNAERWTTLKSLEQTGSSAETNEGAELGRALVAGDFNDDDIDDLAMGLPGDETGGREAGAVIVVYGRVDDGLDETSGRRILQPEDPEPFDWFGSSLAAGDFDGDGRGDLAVGAPGETVGFTPQAGAVSLFYGARNVLLGASTRHFRQGSGGIAGTASMGDFFGSSLAAADFNNDGAADLVAGVPGETAVAQPRAGAVALIFGGPRTVAPRNEVWMKSACAGAVPAAGDAFGEALAIGNFDDDGNPNTAEFPDLAIGIPGHDHTTVADAGAVCALFGGPARIDGRVVRAAGLGTSDSQLFTQSTPNITGAAEAGDRLGAALAAGDFNGDGRFDLAMGAPDEDVGTILDAGAVNVLRGVPSGLSTLLDQLWHQDR